VDIVNKDGTMDGMGYCKFTADEAVKIVQLFLVLELHLISESIRDSSSS
jgi:hypothetical protein